MTEGRLPFHLSIQGKITDRGGLTIMAEFIRGIGLEAQIRRDYPLPGSNRGIKGWEYIPTLIFHFGDGGRHLEDRGNLEVDTGPLYSGLIDTGHFAPPDAVGDWLRKQGKLHRENIIQRANDNLVRIHLEW